MSVPYPYFNPDRFRFRHVFVRFRPQFRRNAATLQGPLDQAVHHESTQNDLQGKISRNHSRHGHVDVFGIICNLHVVHCMIHVWTYLWSLVLIKQYGVYLEYQRKNNNYIEYSPPPSVPLSPLLSTPGLGGTLMNPKKWFFERFYKVKSNWKSSPLFCLLFPLASCWFCQKVSSRIGKNILYVWFLYISHFSLYRL